MRRKEQAGVVEYGTVLLVVGVELPDCFKCKKAAILRSADQDPVLALVRLRSSIDVVEDICIHQLVS